MPTIDENITRFEQLLSSVQRDGIDKLMRYIKKSTDFYKAPASTRFHLACEGGLLQHSLNVYDCLTAKRESPFWKDVLKDILAEINIKRVDKDHFKTEVMVCTSPTFYGWVFQWGGRIQIEGPEEVVQGYKKMLHLAFE